VAVMAAVTTRGVEVKDLTELALFQVLSLLLPLLTADSYNSDGY